jgi:hypothetical protein
MGATSRNKSQIHSSSNLNQDKYSTVGANTSAIDLLISMHGGTHTNSYNTINNN